MIAILLANWRVLAVAGIAVASFMIGWLWHGDQWESKYQTREAAYETLRADTEAAARVLLATAYRAAEIERERIDADGRAATAAAEVKAQNLAARLKKTQAALAAAITDNPECRTWAEQPISCPVSWR